MTNTALRACAYDMYRVGLLILNPHDDMPATPSHRLRDGLKYILNVSRHGNGHIQAAQPWKLVKGTPEDRWETMHCTQHSLTDMA